MAKEKTQNKLGRKEILYFVWIAVALAVIVAVFFIYSQESKTKNEFTNADGSLSVYDENACRCLEKERHQCKIEGFIYNITRELCVNYEEKKVTYSTLSCSKYECGGTLYSFNQSEETWGPQ